jgi:8-oxo-dGTP pyrophosphatase MutT (NUDIX family)
MPRGSLWSTRRAPSGVRLPRSDDGKRVLGDDRRRRRARRDPLEAARREYLEETGHEAPHDLGAIVWHRTSRFEWDGAWMDADEVFYFLRVEKELTVSEAHVETLRSEGVIGHRWLTLAELRSTDLELYPVGLAHLVADLLKNGPPAYPVELRD